jgi:hypothetical protein
MSPISRPVSSDISEFENAADDHSRSSLETPKWNIILLAEDSEAGCPCSVVGFQRGEIHVRTDRWIKPTIRVRLRLDGIPVCGVVSYCIQEKDGFLTCIAKGFAEERGRRSSYRQPVDTPCELLTPGHSDSRWVEGRIKDYSWFGMGVDSALNPKVGTVVCVKTDAILIAGIVRHYRRCEDGVVRTGLDVTDVLTAANSAGRSEGRVNRFRHRLAEFIAGRPIDPLPEFHQTIPWASSLASPASGTECRTATPERPQ